MTTMTARNLLIVTAKLVGQNYAAIEDQLEALMREYGKQYQAAGLVTRWDDVPIGREEFTWQPDTDTDAVYFTGQDRDGDGVSYQLPFAWILDPQGYIDKLVGERAEQIAKDKEVAKSVAVEFRVAQIEALETQLATLRAEQEAPTP